jgi:hypothetical protein
MNTQQMTLGLLKRSDENLFSPIFISFYIGQSALNSSLMPWEFFSSSFVCWVRIIFLSLSNELDTNSQVSKGEWNYPISWDSFFLWCLILVNKRNLKSENFALSLSTNPRHFLDVTVSMCTNSCLHATLDSHQCTEGKRWPQRGKSLIVQFGTLIKQAMSSLWNASFMGLPAGRKAFSQCLPM